MKSTFLSLISAALHFSSSETAQTAALNTWSDTYVPQLTQEAQTMVSGPFSWEEVGLLAETAVHAAQELKGIFKGQDRATIAQVVLVESVKAALPDGVEHWVIPLVNSAAVKSLVEAAFQKIFGPEVVPHTPAVVDAPEVPEGGIQ